MRKIIVLVTAIAFSMGCFGQNSKESVDYSLKNNELNIGYFSAFELSAINELGIGYKVSWMSGALRLGTGFNLNTAFRDGEDYQFDEKAFGFSPRIGYEFHQQFKRLRLYYGADVLTSFYKAVYEESFPVIDPYETETYLNVMYYKSVYEQENPDATTTTKGMDVGSGPLGIVSLNFHF